CPACAAGRRPGPAAGAEPGVGPAHDPGRRLGCHARPGAARHDQRRRRRRLGRADRRRCGRRLGPAERGRVTVLSYVVAAVVGAVVGAAELASRYRDRPAVLVAAPSAWLYALLNAAAAALALLLVESFGWTFGLTEAKAVEVLRVMVASLSAMAVFRSSLFTVRIGDADVGVGPSTLLTTLLGIADRSVDRRRAADRSTTVT